MCCGATKPIQPQQMSLCTMTRERPHCKEDPVKPNMFLNNLKNKKEAVCLMTLIFTHLPFQKEAWKYKPGTLSIETLWDLRTFVIAFSFKVTFYLLPCIDLQLKTLTTKKNLWCLQEQKRSDNKVRETVAKQNAKDKRKYFSKWKQSAGFYLKELLSQWVAPLPLSSPLLVWHFI